MVTLTEYVRNEITMNKNNFISPPCDTTVKNLMKYINCRINYYIDNLQVFIQEDVFLIYTTAEMPTVPVSPYFVTGE